MKGCKADATVLLYEGICVKPSFLWGTGHGKLFSGGIAAGVLSTDHKEFQNFAQCGHCLELSPFWNQLEELQLFDLRERFRSDSPFIGMELAIPSMTSGP